MRNLNAAEIGRVAGGDFYGDAMIRVGNGLQNDAHRVDSLPGGGIVSPTIDRAGRSLADAGYRRNDQTGGGPPGGGDPHAD